MSVEIAGSGTGKAKETKAGLIRERLNHLKNSSSAIREKVVLLTTSIECDDDAKEKVAPSPDTFATEILEGMSETQRNLNAALAVLNDFI